MSKALYRKNIRQWEQWSRVAGGVAMFVAALVVGSGPGAVLLVAGGLMMVVTGFVGWCPACAMVGRSLEDADRARS